MHKHSKVIDDDKESFRINPRSINKNLILEINNK